MMHFFAENDNLSDAIVKTDLFKRPSLVTDDDDQAAFDFVAVTRNNLHLVLLIYKRFRCHPLYAAAVERVSRVKFSHDRVTVKDEG